MAETKESPEAEPYRSEEISAAPPAMSEAERSSGRTAAMQLARLRSLAQLVGSQDYIGVLIATVVLVLAIGAVYPNFLAVGQLLDILNQATFVAILACGMAFLLAMRELDLSVGSTYGLTSLCAALLMHAGVPSWLGALAVLVIGMVLGLVNGLLIQLFRLPSIVATL